MLFQNHFKNNTDTVDTKGDCKQQVGHSNHKDCIIGQRSNKE